MDQVVAHTRTRNNFIHKFIHTKIIYGGKPPLPEKMLVTDIGANFNLAFGACICIGRIGNVLVYNNTSSHTQQS